MIKRTTRQQTFTPALKTQVALELLTGVTSIAEACWQYHVQPQQLNGWKEEFLAKSPRLFAKGEQSDDTHQVAELKRLANWLITATGDAK